MRTGPRQTVDDGGGGAVARRPSRLQSLTQERADWRASHAPRKRLSPAYPTTRDLGPKDLNYTRACGKPARSPSPRPGGPEIPLPRLLGPGASPAPLPCPLSPLRIPAAPQSPFRACLSSLILPSGLRPRARHAIRQMVRSGRGWTRR